MRQLQRQAPAETGSIHDALRTAESQESLVLTATYREQLLSLMEWSNDPGEMLRLGMAIYRQGIAGGDTSVCVDILERAASGLTQRQLHARHVHSAAFNDLPCTSDRKTMQ